MAVAGGAGRLVHTVKVGTGGPGWRARWGCEVLKPQGGGVVYLTTIISCSFPHLEGCLKASLPCRFSQTPQGRCGQTRPGRAPGARSATVPSPKHC